MQDNFPVRGDARRRVETGDRAAAGRCVSNELMSEKASLLPRCSGSSLCPMPPVPPAGALVGRDSEMALLRSLIKEVARGHGGAVVLIEGEPGIGKSSLVRAAVAEAPETGCEVFWGSGDELG